MSFPASPRIGRPVERWIVGFCALVALATFVFVYADLWVLVGRFPAESLVVADPQSNAALALCYKPGRNAAQFSTFVPPFADGSFRGHVLDLGPSPHLADIAGIAGSRSLVYATDRRAIYAINPLDGDALSRLDALAFWGTSRPATVNRFEGAIRKIYPNCPDPVTDRGITEAYWATKGTGVLHHWAFLYDASVFDGKRVHAQYGSLVSAAAHAISASVGLAGPTGFVRVAWWVLCVVGIAAASGLWFVLRRTPWIAVLAVSGQTLAFVSLGSFSILLAPGYHWTRELVIVAPLLLVALLERIGFRARFRAIITVIAAFALCDLTDPSFALLAFVCLILALAIREHGRLRELAARAPRLVAYGVLGAVVLVGVFAIVDRSNLVYVVAEVAMYSGAAVVDSGRNNVFLMDGVLAAIALGLGWYRRVDLCVPYFALTSIVVFLYYAVTPDNFHFGKYVAYSIPLYASLGAALYGQMVRLRFAPVRVILNLSIFVASLTICCSAIVQLVTVGPEWQLRTYDSASRAYFASEPHVVNGRVIDADLNAQTVDRLATFPATLPYDYLVSPLDKYVLFLYDRHNGFDSVDNLSTMTDDARLTKLESTLTKPGSRTILDSETFVVDPRSGILSNHPVMGSINGQSALNQADRVRYNELAARLLHACSSRSVDAAHRWFYVTC